MATLVYGSVFKCTYMELHSTKWWVFLNRLVLLEAKELFVGYSELRSVSGFFCAFPKKNTAKKSSSKYQFQGE